MARINSSKKLVLEDYPKDTSWAKLISTLNPFLENVYYSLVNGITLRDNIKSQISEIKIKENNFPVKIKWTLNERPTVVMIGHIQEDSASPGTIPVHSLQWSFRDGEVQVTVSGLDAAKDYNLRIIGIV